MLVFSVRAKGHDRGNSSDSEKKSGHGSEIPAPVQIKKASAKNNDKKDSGAKENHGGRGDHANSATGGRRGAGNPAGNMGKGQMGSAPTSTPIIGHPNNDMPSRHLPPPGTATPGLYYQAGGAGNYMYNSIFRDENVNLFSDENPNSCSVM